MADDLKTMLADALATSQREQGYVLGMAAFRFGFAPVEMYRSRWEWHYDPAAASHLGAINEMHHTTRRAEPKDTFFVTPLVDAPYSRTFVDLSNGPYVLSVPAIDDRYFTVQLLDFYTNSFDYVGTSQGDTTGGNYLIVPPGWRGTCPEEFIRVITAPTPVVCILARVTILGDDVAAAVASQTQISIGPLDPETPAPSPPSPYLDFRTGDPLDFFRMLAAIITENPPTAADAGLLGLIEPTGVAPHRSFDPDALHPAFVDGLRRAIPASLQSLLAEVPIIGPSVHGWIKVPLDRVGNFGVDYFLRTETAQAGLLANRSQEAYYIGAVFDSDGDPLTGDHKYLLHFEADEFPPVDAFWSVTMYMNPEGFLVENDLGRYHLGSLSKGLTYNADGSLDIYIQRDSPGADKASNWLPCTMPGALFRVILRQYLPQPEILCGRYTPPPVRRIS